MARTPPRFALLALGLLTIYGPALRTGFDLAPGDAGDARIMIFLLESTWRALLARTLAAVAADVLPRARRARLQRRAPALGADLRRVPAGGAGAGARVLGVVRRPFGVRLPVRVAAAASGAGAGLGGGRGRRLPVRLLQRAHDQARPRPDDRRHDPAGNPAAAARGLGARAAVARGGGRRADRPAGGDQLRGRRGSSCSWARWPRCSACSHGPTSAPPCGSRRCGASASVSRRGWPWGWCRSASSTAPRS